jgi:hypothetical protein
MARMEENELVRLGHLTDAVRKEKKQNARILPFS